MEPTGFINPPMARVCCPDRFRPFPPAPWHRGANIGAVSSIAVRGNSTRHRQVRCRDFFTPNKDIT
jgi:hypothetical protein